MATIQPASENGTWDSIGKSNQAKVFPTSPSKRPSKREASITVSHLEPVPFKLASMNILV